MKKAFVLITLLTSMFFCVCSYSGDIVYDTLPAGGISEHIYLGEIQLDSSEFTEYKVEDTVDLFSDSPDWTLDYSRDCYTYLGNINNGEHYQALYQRLFSVMQDCLYNSSAKFTYYVTEKYGGLHFICVNINEFKDMSLNDASSKESPTILSVFNAVLQDNPQFFFDQQYYMSMYDNYGNLYLLIEIDEKYADNDFRIKEADSITKTIAEYDNLISNKNLTRYGIEKKVHDKLITDNRYAYDENGQPESEKFAHSIAGSLNKESYSGGVCESYAKTMQLLMNRYGVPCRYVAGLAADSSGNAEGHAWNYVMLDDNEYHCVDVTWDSVGINGAASTTNAVAYHYFNKPYTDFYSGRDNSYTYFASSLPICSENTNYFTSDGPYLTGEKTTNYRGYLTYFCNAPLADEDAYAKTSYTTTEVSTETTTAAATYEYSTEATTHKYFQLLAENSVDKTPVVNAEGNAWGVGRYSSTGADTTYKYFAYPTSNGAVMSIVTSEDYMFSFDYHISSNDSYYEVYIDEKLAATLEYTGDYYSSYTLTTGRGMHKISFKFKDDDGANFGTGETIYNFNFIKCGDVNFDNAVDIIDAVNILSIDEPDYNLIAIYDYNKDNILDNKDAAAVLRKVAGI